MFILSLCSSLFLSLHVCVYVFTSIFKVWKAIPRWTYLVNPLWPSMLLWILFESKTIFFLPPPPFFFFSSQGNLKISLQQLPLFFPSVLLFSHRPGRVFGFLVSAATGGTHPTWRRQQLLLPDPTSVPTLSFYSSSRWICWPFLLLPLSS